MKFDKSTGPESVDSKCKRRCPDCKSLNTRFVGNPNDKRKVCNACGYDERAVKD